MDAATKRIGWRGCFGILMECYGLDDVDSLLLEKSYVMDWDISNVLKWLGGDYCNLVR